MEFAGYIYDHNVYDIPLPSGLVLTGFGISLLAIMAVLGVIFGMPLAIPSDGIKKEDIVSILALMIGICFSFFINRDVRRRGKIMQL